MEIIYLHIGAVFEFATMVLLYTLLPALAVLLWAFWKWHRDERSLAYYEKDAMYYRWSKAKGHGLTLGEWKKDRYAFDKWTELDSDIPFKEWVETCITPQKRLWWRKYKNAEICEGYPGETAEKRGENYVPKRRWFR